MRVRLYATSAIASFLLTAGIWRKMTRAYSGTLSWTSHRRSTWRLSLGRCRNGQEWYGGAALLDCRRIRFLGLLVKRHVAILFPKADGQYLYRRRQVHSQIFQSVRIRLNRDNPAAKLGKTNRQFPNIRAYIHDMVAL